MEQDIVNGIKGVWAVYAATREKLRAETTAERKRYLGRNKVYDGIKRSGFLFMLIHHYTLLLPTASWRRSMPHLRT